MTMVPSVADIFLTLPETSIIVPPLFCSSGNKIFDANFRLFVDMVGNVRQAFIDSLLLLLVQFRTAFGQPGCFSNGIIGVLTGQLDQIGVEKCKQPFPILWDEQKKFFGIE